LTYVEEKLNKMGKILNPCFSENQASFLSLDKRAFNVNVSSGKKMNFVDESRFFMQEIAQNISEVLW